MDPKSFSGTLYAVADWRLPGASKGHACSNGRYTGSHGDPRQRHGLPLRRDACRRLRATDALLAAWELKAGISNRSVGPLPSIDATVAQVDDVRRSQGRKPCMASVLSVGLLSRLIGHTDPVAAAELTASLGQKDLAAIGSWKNTVTGRHEPVSGSTLHRVIQTLGSEQMQAVLQRHGQPRLHIAQAVTVDASRATRQDRLAWTRGHQLVERYHHVRDVTFKEDDWTARTRSAPSDNAIMNTIAIAVILETTARSANRRRASPRACAPSAIDARTA